MAQPSSPHPYAHGLITVAIGLSDRVVFACDRTANAEMHGEVPDAPRVLEVQKGFVVGGSGIWATTDQSINAPRDILAAFRHEDTAEAFLQRYDRLYRLKLERYLTQRYAVAGDAVLRDYFCPLTPPQSLIVAEFNGPQPRLALFEYIPTLTNNDTILLTPLMRSFEVSASATFAAIGAAAPHVAELDADYINRAAVGPRGPEYTASMLAAEAISHVPKAVGPPIVHTVAAGAGPERPRRSSASRKHAAVTRLSNDASRFPPVDTRDVAAVQQFVQRRFEALYPSAELAWFPTALQHIVRCFGGHTTDYAPIDLRYHDLEHTLQAVVCAALILSGRHAARVVPRIDAHHFELALMAALLHDTGYLKLRSDTQGTGAKYTYCHVLRSCAFAASYLPTVGANADDIETVLAAINCTGPLNEISRLRFQAPVDEIIGCVVASADFLGQMAAPDYPDKLRILFGEFEESDNYLQVPPELRMFKSAEDLVTRTPHFWHRYVLPKLEADFHGVYHFLAHPYPTGRNPYLDAIEAGIAEIQRRLSSVPVRGLGAALADNEPVSPTLLPVTPLPVAPAATTDVVLPSEAVR